MAGQQPAHWRQPQGRGKPSTTAPAPTPAPSAAPAPPAPLAAFASVSPPDTWATRDYDLSCASIVKVGNDSPSSDVLACLATPGNTCLLDSGTSRNLICDWAHLRSYSADDSVRVRTANHGYLLTSGSGECIGLLNVGGHKHKVKFSGCLHAPGAMLNLLSVGWMLAKGWDCHFHGGPSRCDLSYRSSPSAVSHCRIVCASWTSNSFALMLPYPSCRNQHHSPPLLVSLSLLTFGTHASVMSAGRLLGMVPASRMASPSRPPPHFPSVSPV